ncbi:RND family transporter [Mycobacterium sp. 852002-51057_SCH5723018]|uniref:MMPL/RND family transporter n=1 Tax=Mycobacterium sp. 852002-51057_SCH5723018 TaxID=1834094 RepID=UPI000A870D2C|nr:MMPL family transporter [Mycobacterium sp. 852002-51057_SCH5723018]
MIARTVRRLSVPILLFWLGLAAVTNIVVPQLEAVGETHAVSMSPDDAPAIQATQRVGRVFHEFDSDSAVMVVLEGQAPLGDAAHRFYDDLIRKLAQDHKHVEHVQDFWGDPLTAAGSQSADGKAAYVQVFLAGRQGETLANESVDAVRHIVSTTVAPNGVRAYIAGPAAVTTDELEFGDKSVRKVMGVTVAVIVLMLLIVYRSLVTVLLTLLMVFIELPAVQGVIAFLGSRGVIGLSTFAVQILPILAIAAGTDYAIFVVGRYQEARHAGEDREAAYYTMFRGSAHVVLGSGLTIAGAMFCLSFTRLPYFQTLGAPCAIGMFTMVAGALTLGPAILTLGSRFGLFDPKRNMKTRGWRRLGTAVVRWPTPILAATCAIALVGLLALPSFTTSYSDRKYLPAITPSNIGYAAADRHFSPARLNPDLLLIETDHDMRNPADMLVLDRVTKGVFQADGVARVQAITRPLGTPIEHTSIPFQISMQSTTLTENMKYMHDRMADMRGVADQMTGVIDTMQRMLVLMRGLADTTHDVAGQTRQIVADTNDVRDRIADFDDFFRPLRGYFSWERHCFDIPVCWALRSIFDALDGVDKLTGDLGGLVKDTDRLDTLMPQLISLLPPIIGATMTMRTMTMTMYSSFSGLLDQMDAAQQNATAMGQAFDAAKNDDSFYLPPEVFDNPDFKRGLSMFLSPDGKAARFIITHDEDPATPEGVSHVNAIKKAAKHAVKGTPLEDAKIQLGGTAATYKDMSDAAKYDLLIAGIAAACLIFVIMLILTRSVIAALVIIGTVLLSLGSSFGLSVLVWQDILGIPLHWLVIAMALIVLLAVGSDYNLLLVSRFKEEIGAGIKTGIIRAMGGTGAVVTSAGLVFAFTMASFVFSDLRIIGQFGTTVGIGLLFDTLVVRSLMTPAIAALLGPWFWWPRRVGLRTRAARLPAAEVVSAMTVNESVRP